MPRFVRALLRHYRHEIGGFNRSLARKKSWPVDCSDRIGKTSQYRERGSSQAVRQHHGMIMGVGFTEPRLKSPDHETIFCSHLVEFDGPVSAERRRTRWTEQFKNEREARSSYGRAALPVISLRTFHFCDGVIERANTPLHTL